MKVEQALNMVDTITYKPGWTFTASDACNRFEDTIVLTITYDALDTSSAPDYTEHVFASAKYPIMVGHLDGVGLYHEIMRRILQVEEHEAREFFRIAPTYDAPFHPHTFTGITRWGDPNADLMFGLA